MPPPPPQSRPPKSLKTLLIPSCFLVLALAFFVMAAEVGETPSGFDSAAARLIQPANGAGTARGTFASHFWSNITALGSGPLVGLIVTMVLGYLVLARHPWTALVVLLCVVSAGVSGMLLKSIFERARPMDLATLLRIDGYSFPSGHSVISGAVYPVLASLMGRVVQGRHLKAYCFASGGLLMVLVGMSRIYLGVHYATDVLAGWSVGLSFALFGWVLLSRLQERGVVEESPVAVEFDEDDETTHAVR